MVHWNKLENYWEQVNEEGRNQKPNKTRTGRAGWQERKQMEYICMQSLSVCLSVCMYGHWYHVYSLLPLLPPFLLVESVGMGVTSSILPILSPERASALSADCAPGPGVFVLFPPVARSFT